MDKITIIVPCYNEEDVLPLFNRAINDMMSEMTDQDVKLLFVDDGSKDRTREIIKALASDDSHIAYIALSKNFGKEAAMYAGLQHADGDYVVIMDADMQDPPMMIPVMYRMIKETQAEAVGTRRKTREGEPPLRSFFAHAFYKIMRRFCDIEIVDSTRDFRMMTRKYADALLEMKEVNRFWKGIYGWLGFKTVWIEYDNKERAAGKTKWSFWQLLKYAVEGLVAFGTKPLTWAFFPGTLFLLIGLAGMIVSLIKGVDLLTNTPVLLVSSLVLGVGGTILIAMGVMGLYLSKMYTETKKRPIYLVDEIRLWDNE